MLVVFGGLPGVGKTTLAAALARRIGAGFVRIDAIETGIGSAGLTPPGGLGAAGYQVAHQVVRSMLVEELDVVVDAVNPVGEARQGWVHLSAGLGVGLRTCEVVCSDVDLHRRRVEDRVADLPGHVLPTWHDVLDLVYEPWPEVDLVVDSARPGDVVLDEIVECLR